jgi:DNA polymerase
MQKPLIPCSSCIGYSWSKQDYVPPSGTGDNGVLLIGEASGEHEAQEGIGLVGKAGHYLFSNLQRAGIEREGFRIANVLACRPPGNKLAGTAYEMEAINHCSPLLDATIRDMHERCHKSGRHLVILTLGRIAFKRVMGFTDKSPEMRVDYQCYPFWSEKYSCHVLAADHPSYLMRGNNHLLPVLQFCFKRALEIASEGFNEHTTTYLRDPDPQTFSQWVRDFEHYGLEHPEETYLAFDIETPYKSGKDEEEVAREDNDDYSILRCSFSYVPGSAISVPWNAGYLPYLEQIFATPYAKVAHNANYDVPRITASIPINGDILDNMVAWHVLNSALPKGLGFITPFYCKDMRQWKHLSGSDPAGYNCQDSDATIRDFLGIKRDLVHNSLWTVFQRHVVMLDKVLSYMSGKGVLRDEVMRAETEVKLQDLLDVTEIKMEASVPQAARKLKVAKKCPKDLTGWSESHQELPVEVCLSCGLLKPKRWKKHLTLCNGEVGSLGMDTLVWTKPLEFKVSKLGLTNYQKALRHTAITSRKRGEEGKITFDEAAITRLIKQYPTDPLYPLILEHRGVQKLLSTYVGITQYKEVEVPDDYILVDGEKWK